MQVLNAAISSNDPYQISFTVNTAGASFYLNIAAQSGALFTAVPDSSKIRIDGSDIDVGASQAFSRTRAFSFSLQWKFLEITLHSFCSATDDKWTSGSQWGRWWTLVGHQAQGWVVNGRYHPCNARCLCHPRLSPQSETPWLVIVKIFCHEKKSSRIYSVCWVWSRNAILCEEEHLEGGGDEAECVRDVNIGVLHDQKAVEAPSGGVQPGSERYCKRHTGCTVWGQEHWSRLLQ